MRYKDFKKQAKEDFERQMGIYEERNNDYAGEDNHFKNSEIVGYICYLWDIRPDIWDEDTDWFRLVDKLTRDRNKPKRDNLDDAMNYIRRIASWRVE